VHEGEFPEFTSRSLFSCAGLLSIISSSLLSGLCFLGHWHSSVLGVVSGLARFSSFLPPFSSVHHILSAFTEVCNGSMLVTSFSWQTFVQVLEITRASLE